MPVILTFLFLNDSLSAAYLSRVEKFFDLSLGPETSQDPIYMV